jgi:hypothetical protein
VKSDIALLGREIAEVESIDGRSHSTMQKQVVDLVP